MSNYDWGYPNTVWFGNGRIKDLPKACKVLGIKNPLFVTDKDLAKTKMVENALEINKKANLPTTVFSDLKGNPLGSNVKKGSEIFKSGNHDGVISFGGLGEMLATVYSLIASRTSGFVMSRFKSSAGIVRKYDSGVCSIKCPKPPPASISSCNLWKK